MSSPSDEESFRTACQSGALPAVAAFLANPLFDANARNPRFGSTGFILACVYGQAAVVELLLGAPGGRVDVNARDNEGWSGVYGAVAFQKHDVVRLLLSHADRVDLMLPDNKGARPIDRTNDPELKRAIEEAVNRVKGGSQRQQQQAPPPSQVPQVQQPRFQQPPPPQPQVPQPPQQQQQQQQLPQFQQPQFQPPQPIQPPAPQQPSPQPIRRISPVQQPSPSPVRASPSPSTPNRDSHDNLALEAAYVTVSAMQMQDDELLRRREAEVRLTNEELRLKRELRDVLSEISRMRRENPELADLEGFKKLIGGLGVSLDSAGADGSALDIEKQRFELLKQRTALEAESAARRREEDEARIAREREILELRAEAERRSRESELEYLKERVRIEGELARLGKSVV